MERERFYRGVFIAGGTWNLLVAVPTFFLVHRLASMFGLEEPRYPIFIYFNLMTVAMFGFVAFYVARNLATSRGLVKILVYSKLLTFAIFGAAYFALKMPDALINLIGPGMFVDLALGMLYWRYLVLSAPKAPRE